jgi:Protein of unknown function (DUF3800)
LAIDSVPKYHVYCDESSQTKHRYIVLGALICQASNAPRIAATIEHIIKPHGGTSELKWERRNLPMYKAVASGFGQMIERGYLHYYALVVDTHQVDHEKYNEGDPELGFSKFLFTLLFKFARVYQTDYRFYVFLDERTTKHTPELLRTILNARARRQNIRDFDPYRTVEFVKSEKSRLIQLTDVITGAIAYETNMHHVAPGAASYKIEMMRHVTACVHARRLAIPTPVAGKGFDIWHLDLAITKKRPLRT